MREIEGYHSHIYFNAETLDRAKALAERAGEQLPVEVGRVHEKPVGPHPMWSCQLSYRPEDFEQVMSWLAMNRDGLTIFTHPLTGDVIAEHRDFAMWMGSVEKINIAVLQKMLEKKEVS